MLKFMIMIYYYIGPKWCRVFVHKKKPLSMIKMHQPKKEKWNAHHTRLIFKQISCHVWSEHLFSFSFMHCATMWLAALFSQNLFRFKIITWILVFLLLNFSNLRPKKYMYAVDDYRIFNQMKLVWRKRQQINTSIVKSMLYFIIIIRFRRSLMVEFI